MTHASLPQPSLAAIDRVATHAPASDRSQQDMAVTLWFLSFAAIGLGFASLLLIGLVARGIAADSVTRGLVSGSAVVLAAVASAAFACAYAMARRYEMLESAGETSESTDDPADGGASATTGLVMAAKVHPKGPVPQRLRGPRQRRSRSRQVGAMARTASDPLYPRSAMLRRVSFASPTFGVLGHHTAAAIPRRRSPMQPDRRYTMPPRPVMPMAPGLPRTQAGALQLRVVGLRAPARPVWPAPETTGRPRQSWSVSPFVVRRHPVPSGQPMPRQRPAIYAHATRPPSRALG